jgi:hypothetical protein
VPGIGELAGSRGASSMYRIEPAVDAAGFEATLHPLGEESPDMAGELDLAPILARLAELSDDTDAVTRVNAATEWLAPAMTQMSTRFALGEQIEDIISSWENSDPVKDLTNHLTLVIPLNNRSSARSVSLSLRRAIQQDRLGRDQKQLTLLVELALLFHNTTDLDVELFELRDVFRDATAIPFPLLSRIGRRLVVGNRHGRQLIELREMVQTLFARRRIATISDIELTRGTKNLIAEIGIQEWSRILPTLYFSAGSARSEFGASCSKFLEICFNEHDPALLLTLLPKPDQRSWLARIIDLGSPGISREEFHDLIQSKGVVAPDIPEEEGEPLLESFFDRVARAHLNGAAWIKQHLRTGNVVRLYGRRES